MIMVMCPGYHEIGSTIASRKRPLPGKSPDFTVIHLLNAHKRNEGVCNRKIYKFFWIEKTHSNIHRLYPQ